MDCQTDEQLTGLIKEGNVFAFKALYNRYGNLLFVYISKSLHHQDDAQDIVQEVFAQLWNSRESLNITTSISSYLYASVRNKMIDLIRRNGLHKKYLEQLDTFEADNIMADHLVREKQLAALIEKEIDALPIKMREVFLLSRSSDLSHQEISDQLGLQKQTVRSHVKRALKILRLKF